MTPPGPTKRPIPCITPENNTKRMSGATNELWRNVEHQSISKPTEANDNSGDQPNAYAHRKQNPEVVSAYKAVAEHRKCADCERGKHPANQRAQHQEQNTNEPHVVA